MEEAEGLVDERQLLAVAGDARQILLLLLSVRRGIGEVGGHPREGAGGFPPALRLLGFGLPQGLERLLALLQESALHVVDVRLRHRHSLVEWLVPWPAARARATARLRPRRSCRRAARQCASARPPVSAADAGGGGPAPRWVLCRVARRGLGRARGPRGSRAATPCRSPSDAVAPPGAWPAPRAALLPPPRCRTGSR